MTRHEARQCALQALYQIDASDSETLEAIAFALEDKSFSDADLAYVRSLVEGVRNHLIDIDQQLKSVMERWSPDRTGRVELNILRLAAYELSHDLSIPAASIVDEAVKLAKAFSTETAGKFVNGVLAKVLPVLRPQYKNEPRSSGETD